MAHPNLTFQLKRFREENPVYLVQDLQGLEAYMLKLRDHLALVGLDFLFILENLEDWDLKEPLEHFLPSVKALSECPNTQILVANTKALLGLSPLKLGDLSIDAIWEAPGPDQEKVMAYCRGNIGFIKSWLEVASQENANALFFKARHPLFTMMRGRFTDLQWKLLRSIAHYELVEQPHAFAFLVKHNFEAASSVERALRNLLDTRFLQKTKEGYRTANPLMHRWMQYVYDRKTFS